MIADRTDRSAEYRGGRASPREEPETRPQARKRDFRSAALIVNTRSRLGRTAAGEALDYLRVLGVPVVAAHAVDDPSRLAEAVREAVSQGHDLIVLGGGDGSVGFVAGLLAGSDATPGLLPLGTANDFARTLGIPFYLGAACAAAADGEVVRADLGLAGDKRFVNVASMGLGGASPRLKRATGALSYPLAALRAYRGSAPFEAGFVFPEGDHESLAIEGLVHVAVGNGRYYGGGMVVAPSSDIEDHALDVYAIEATDPLSLGRIAWTLRTGGFVSSERVHHWRTREVCVIADPRLPVNLDGELAHEIPRRFSVLPDALKVIVPPRPTPVEEPAFASPMVAAFSKSMRAATPHGPRDRTTCSARPEIIRRAGGAARRTRRRRRGAPRPQSSRPDPWRGRPRPAM